MHNGDEAQRKPVQRVLDKVKLLSSDYVKNQVPNKVKSFVTGKVDDFVDPYVEQVRSEVQDRINQLDPFDPNYTQDYNNYSNVLTNLDTWKAQTEATAIDTMFNKVDSQFDWFIPGNSKVKPVLQSMVNPIGDYDEPGFSLSISPHFASPIKLVEDQTFLDALDNARQGQFGPLRDYIERPENYLNSLMFNGNYLTPDQKQFNLKFGVSSFVRLNSLEGK